MSSSSTTTRSNLGPLTTSFKYPDSCTVVVQECTTCDVGWQAQTCGDNPSNGQGVEDNPDCWPARDTTDYNYITTGYALNGWGFYSPGISCPVGYATSCVATGSVDGGFPFQFSIEKSETAVGCCPTGFICAYDPGVDNAQTCYSIATTGSFATVQCSNGKSNGFSYLEMPATLTVPVATTEEVLETVSAVAETELITTSFLEAGVLSTVTVLAPMFQLVFQAKDLPSTASGPISVSTASIASETAKSTSTSKPSSGLSTGAKAGIGVGVSLGALALLGAALFFFLRRRKSAPAAAPVTNEPKTELPGQFVHPVELPEGTSPRVPPSELQG